MLLSQHYCLDEGSYGESTEEIYDASWCPPLLVLLWMPAGGFDEDVYTVLIKRDYIIARG